MSIKVSAPGKLHLLGEHSAVYGKPAFIAAVEKRVFVEISPSDDGLVEIVVKNINVIPAKAGIYRNGVLDARLRGHDMVLGEREIVKKTKSAREVWKKFIKTKDIKLLKSITENPFDYLILSIGETLEYFKKTLPSGLRLTINSEIPIGSGMGSSAAVPVAIAGAISIFLGQKFDKEKINEIAFLTEHYRHGFPSGGDNSASCYGGFVWYRKENESLKIVQPVSFRLSGDIAKNFFIIDTGKPNESTGEMVNLVSSFVKKNPSAAWKIFDEQEMLTRNFLSAIKNSDENEIINTIKNGEKNLEKLGVVSGYVKKIIREIEKSGGAAKICGGGGKTKGTGILLGYSKKKIKFKHDNVFLGVEGVRVEH